MDDSIKTVLAVKTIGIHTCIAMNCYNLDFTDEEITNIYNMEEFYNKIQELQKEETA